MEHVGHDAMERGRGGSVFGRVSPNRLLYSGPKWSGFSRVLDPMAAGSPFRRCALVWLAALAVCLPIEGASRAELKVQLGHSNQVNSVAFSSDGRWALTGSADNTARLWDIASGREIRRFESNWVNSAAFSPDGHSVITGSHDGIARLWAVTTGREIRRFAGHEGEVTSTAFSPDGRLLLTGGRDGTARLWDVASGNEVRRMAGNSTTVESVAFAPNASTVLVAWGDGTASLLDPATARELHRLKGYSIDGSNVAYAPDSRSVLTGSWNGAAHLWNVASGSEIRVFRDPSVDAVRAVAFAPDGHSVFAATVQYDAASGQVIRRFREFSNIEAVTYSPDSRFVLAGSNDDTAILWDLASGREVRRLEGRASWVCAVAFAPDGHSILTGSWNNTATIWDLVAGREARRVQGSDAIEAIAFSPDSRSFVTGGAFGDRIVRLWDVATGKELRRFPAYAPQGSLAFSPDGGLLISNGENSTALIQAVRTGREVMRLRIPSNSIGAAAFSPDGRVAVTGSGDHTARIWDLATGAEIHSLNGHSENVNSVAFSPDGRAVLTGSADGTVRLWDAGTGTETRRIDTHTLRINSAVFSPDGHRILIGCQDKAAIIWDIASNREVLRLDGHGTFVSSVAFSADGRFALTGGPDGSAKIWDSDTGRLLLTFMSFKEGGWAVVDPEGRCDSSDSDSSPGLYWQLGDEIIELQQLKQRFYTPHLLARTLGFNPQPLPRVAGLNNVGLWPVAQVNEPAPGRSTATIRFDDRGGGIGRVVVKVNGREIPVASRGAPVQPNTPIPVDLSAAELAADGNNTIEVIAYAGDNLVASRGVQVVWRRSPENASAPPVLHAIVAGVSEYESASISLRFPAKDAQDMAHALEIGGKRLFGADRIEVATFTTGSAHEPTKENLRNAFEAISAKAQPNDVVLVYLAGHGVAGKAGSDIYYYLTRDARTTNPDDDPKLWAQTTISSAELLEWLRRKGMPLRQVVVLDTCAAGAAITDLLKLAAPRELTADQERALVLLKDATGSHVLMGAAADKVSYEASRYGQGLLTYALLLGMRGEALDEGGRLEVRKWFDTAQHRVPQLAQGIGGIQQPVVSSPTGQTFPIGLYTPADRSQIPLPTFKPQLLRARVEDADQNDPLQLDGPVRAALRSASTPATRGQARPEPPLVYLDQVAGDVVDAYIPQVRYMSEGDTIRIRLRLAPSNPPREVNFTATARDTAELAKRIVDEFVKMLAAPK